MSNSDLEIPSSPNSYPFTMLIVGDYLIIGMINEAGTDEYGIATLNLSDGTKTKPSANKLMGNVSHIMAGKNNKSAMIATDKGLVFFYDGKLINIGNDNDAAISYKRLKPSDVSEAQPVAFTNDKDATLDFTKVKAGAVHVGDHWYVGSEQGVFKIKMEEKQK